MAVITERPAATDAAVPGTRRGPLVPWWVFLLTGLAFGAYGLVVLSFTIATFWAIAIATAVLLAAVAVAELGRALLVDELRWLHGLLGLAALGGAITTFVWPDATFLMLVNLIGWYLVFRGLFTFVMALDLRGVYDLWWLQLTAGVAQIVLGMWAIGYTGRSTALLVLWVGIAALFEGVVQIVYAFRVRAMS